MKDVADYIHSKGLKAGIYTDAGIDGCGGTNDGSYGHYQQDFDQFAAWGYDAVKVDFCGGRKQNLNPADTYAKVRDALLGNSSNRPMLLNICNPLRLLHRCAAGGVGARLLDIRAEHRQLVADRHRRRLQPRH